MYVSHLFYVYAVARHTSKQQRSMETTKWISIREASEKYDIPPEKMRVWMERQEVTYAQIGNRLLVDKDSLLRCIGRYVRQSIAEEELEERVAELLREKEEKYFLCKSLLELTPITYLLVYELAEVIRMEEKKELFLFVTLQGGDIEEFARLKNRPEKEVQEDYDYVIREIKACNGFLLNTKEKMLALKSKLHQYEMYFGELGPEQERVRAIAATIRKPSYKARARMLEMAPAEKRSQTAALVKAMPYTNASGEILPEPEDLFVTSLQDLGLEKRAHFRLTEVGIQTVGDLLRFTRLCGFPALCKFPGITPDILKRIIRKLEYLHIIDGNGRCPFYEYLRDNDS